MLTLVAADAIRVPDLHDHICTTGRTMLRDDKPSEYLAIELNEVRRDGTALLEHLTHQTNLQFPPDFPKEALHENRILSPGASQRNSIRLPQTAALCSDEARRNPWKSH
jgi:hypothetical protein